jgi:hypothetical protein
MKRTVAVTLTALICTTAVAPPAAAATPVDVSPVKVSIGRVQPTPANLSYRAYVRGTDSRVWYRVVTATGAPTGSWRALAGAVSTGPDVVPYADRTTHLLAARSTSGSLVMREVRNGVATPWRDYGGTLSSSPSLALATDDRTIAVVARAVNGNTWFRLRRGGVWQRWTNLGGIATSAPDIATAGRSLVGFVVSHRGRNGEIWHKYLGFTGDIGDPWHRTYLPTTSSASCWQQLSGGEPSINGPGFVYRGDDAALYDAYPHTPMPPRRLGGTLTSGPDRDNPGGSKRLIPISPGETTSMVVARDHAHRLALYNLDTGNWFDLGGTVR